MDEVWNDRAFRLAAIAARRTIYVALEYFTALIFLPNIYKRLFLSEFQMKIVRDKASSRRSLTQGSGTLRQDAERTAAPNLDRSQPERDDASETFESVIESSGLLDDRPPVGHGHSGHPFYTVQPMQLLSWHPRAYLFPKFMDADKCKHVIEIASRRLYPSGLALKKGDTMASTQEVRTSQGTFMSRTEDKEGVLAWIEDKIGPISVQLCILLIIKHISLE